MKKHLLTLLLSLSFAAMLAGAVACGSDSPLPPATSGSENVSTDSDSDSGDVSDDVSSGDSTNSDSDSSVDNPDATPCTITFEKDEGYSFVSNVENGKQIPFGQTLAFTVEIGALYTGEPLVYVNDVPTAADADGKYYVRVTEDVHVRVTGVRKDVSMMQGTGTLDNPFWVSKPIDLLYIAEQVNSGNRTYQTAAYLLTNDIDCKGIELEVIGNDPDNDKYFSGSFTSNYDPDTGVNYRHSISNFTINTEGTNYVGLFGAVFADLSIQSSGLFYGVTLENFAINANMYTSESATQTIACGSLVGYGVGTTMYLCEASNGEINISGDSGYFSFVGGLIGYQQGYYFSEYGESVASEISYAKVDVDVTVLSGLVLSAGGISGHLATNYPFGAVASIHNSYATGDVTGAIRSGGIAGSLGQYTTVNNCYATGVISATSNQNNNNDLWKDSEYCIAHAGGIVGFAENDSIVHDCFFGGESEASAVTNYEFAIAGENHDNNKFAFASFGVGGGYDDGYISVDSKKYLEINNVSSLDVDLADKDCFTKALSWQGYDWVFTANEYPQLNYTATNDEVILTMTLRYVAPLSDEEILVDNQTSVTHNYFNNTVESASSYVALGNFFATGSLNFYYTADNGFLSYGYFFDEACTQPVPYAYMPEKNVTLYVGFADPTPLVGEYFYQAENGKIVTLDFKADGTVVYTDGYGTLKTTYSFDGENVFVDGARLARYYLGDVVVDETATDVFQDPNFDLYRYYYYNFAGTLTEDGVTLYDGVYFTKDAPLFASNDRIETTEEYIDPIIGTWTVSATINVTFTFDQDGNWSYSQLSPIANGTYTYADGVYTLVFESGTLTATLEDNALIITEFGVDLSLYRKNGYTGTWKGDNFTIALDGIGVDHTGTALLTYEDGSTLDLVYEESETSGYIAIYLPENNQKGDLFGYFYYDARTNTLSAVLSDAASATGFTACTLLVMDDYYGEWITESEDFGNAEFIFDGMGLYGNGRVRIIKDGRSSTVTYTLNNDLSGSFNYGGTEWKMLFDITDRSITIIEDTLLERKDEFANIDFIDTDGNRYAFDGKGNLSVGGTLTVNETTTYFYKNNGENYLVYSDLGADAIGSISFVRNYVSLVINETESKLYIANDLMGKWAISGEFALFNVGPTDMNGVIQANYRGHDVELTYLDTTLLTFDFTEFSGLPMTYYVFVIDDETTGGKVLVLSEYTNLLGDYIVCSRANEMFGTWTRADGRSIQFDGISSGYQSGIAVLVNPLAGKTYFYYTIKEDGILMWSQDLLQGRTRYYRLDMTDDVSNTTAFVNGDKAFIRTEVDGLCLTRAKDTVTGETYVFDGGCINETNGGIWVGETKKYEYTFITYNTDSTATLTVIDVATGKTYEATLNYKDQQNITFTLGAEIVE
ncbi:MAG: hypothetical protein E7352_01425 [Clostridiales bacterium]|nr:hypothetical protein [Clostridiales bacterium]